MHSEQFADNAVYAIGDIHGCLNELQTLLAQLPLNDNSTLVFLGDYVDRGEDVKGVIDTLIELRSAYAVVTLKGNHEAMFMDFLKDPESQEAAFFIFNGGSSTLASYGNEDGEFNLPQSHREFLNKLILFYEIPGYFFVHAGVPNMELEQIKNNIEKYENQLIWIRSPFTKGKYEWNRTIVHGHTVERDPHVSDRRIGVDTGCVYGGALTAVEVHQRKTYTVERRKAADNSFLKDQRSKRVAVRFKGTVPVVLFSASLNFHFESVNYNNFGMLIRNRQIESHAFKDGDKVSGNIAVTGRTPIIFQAYVVRTYLEDGFWYIALKMEKPVFGN